MADKKAEIFLCARELFSARGFKDTNVAEIMKAAGMAVGTFYNYYKSKDQLFMEIFNEENVQMKKGILDTLDIDGEPAAVIQEMMGRNLQGIMENPILREWYNRDVFSKIEQSFREENAVEHVDFLYDCFIDVVLKWQREGKMRGDISPEMIMAIFGAIVNIDMHKDEIGLQYFPQLQGYISEFVNSFWPICQNRGETENPEIAESRIPWTSSDRLRAVDGSPVCGEEATSP